MGGPPYKPLSPMSLPGESFDKFVGLGAAQASYKIVASRRSAYRPTGPVAARPDVEEVIAIVAARSVVEW